MEKDIEAILIEKSKLVLDTGVWLSYFQNENKSIVEILDRVLFTDNTDIIVIGNEILLSELYYVICRTKGREKAREITNYLINTITLNNSFSLFENVGKIKCKYPISIVDCFSIATSIEQNCPVLFMKEKELTEDIIKKINKEFNAEFIILE